MSIIWFEGFETCGDETGQANEATVRPNIDLRVDIPTDVGTGDVWLEDNEDQDGFALSLGGASNNRAIRLFDGTDLDAMPTGGTAAIVTIGARVHIPSTTQSFSALNLVSDDGAGSSDRFLTARVIDSTDIAIRLASSDLITVQDVFSANSWVYLEIAVRPDGGKGKYATAEVTAEPTDDTFALSITNYQEYQPFWEDGTTYNENDQIRWMGRTYKAIVVSPATTQGDIPDQNPSIWEDQGPEADFVSNSNSSFQPSFYILEDPDRTPRIASGFSGGPPPDTLNSQTAFDHDSGNYIPQAGDTVIIGNNSFYEIRVNGDAVIRGHLTPGGDGILGFNTWRFTERFQANNPTGVTGSGDDFFAVDDVYVTATAEDTATDPLTYTPEYKGPGKIISIPPNSDIAKAWAASSGTDHHPLVDENGADAADYLEASSNGLLDQFGHSDTGVFDGDLHAVRIEVEAINTDAGSPSLEVSMGPSKEISESFTVDNTANYDLFTLDSETKPAGGVWTFDAVDDLISGIETSGL